MNKKKLILGGVLMLSTIIGCCVSASASTITQNTYYSDDIFFPDGQYQMNFNFEVGASASTTGDYNKVIYNNVFSRDIGQVTIDGITTDVSKLVNFQESADSYENIDLISYYTNATWKLSNNIPQYDYDVEFGDSTLINYDLYFRVTDFFYMAKDYQGHTLKWTNIDNNYYTAWEEEDFDVNDDIGFIDYTIFTINDGVIESERITESIASGNLISYSKGQDFFIDAFLIDWITRNGNCYAVYINDCVLKMKDLYYYDTILTFEIYYYHYDDSMFERLGNINYSSPEINVSDFVISSIGGFMDFQIVPGFSFGLLLSFILTLALIVWIIKVFMGG